MGALGVHLDGEVAAVGEGCSRDAAHHNLRDALEQLPALSVGLLGLAILLNVNLLLSVFLLHDKRKFVGFGVFPFEVFA